jgi:hypothetical protein
MREERRSLTSSIQTHLDNTIEQKQDTAEFELSSESIIACAQALGLTIQQYVNKNPDKAVKEAEASLNEWLRIQSNAAIEGSVTITNAETGKPQSHLLNKNMVRLIQDRVNQAQAQLDMVNQYAYTAYNDGEQRRDHLIRVLYKRATEKGDTKALLYLIDRVDGRPGESKQVDLDYDNAYNVYQIIHSLFDKQLEVLNSGVGTKLICCSRRSGKTHLLVAMMLIECLRVPNTKCLYISETMELSEQLVDSAMNEIIHKTGIRDKNGKVLNWRKLDNGSSILIRGLSNTKDPDQIRGHKAKIIVIDEFFHLKSELLEYLQREVLQPMQLDYANDYKFVCVGTPPSIKGTFGEYAWKNWEVPHFFWTYKDNPHPVDVQAREDYVAHVLAEKGLDWTSSFARREYGGEWVYDDDLLLYPEYHTYDPRESTPAWHIDMVLFGLDYGVGANDCLVGIAWDTENRRGYQFSELKFNRLDIIDRGASQLDCLGEEVRIQWERALDFFPGLSNKEANKRILWDADDNDQHVTDHLNLNIRLDKDPTLRLNIQNAHKTDKVIMFDKIKDLLRTGNMLLIKDSKIAKECDQTILKRGPAGQVYPEVDDKTFHPDLLPAFRYAIWNVIGYERAAVKG